MSTPILMLFVGFVAFSQVACSGGGKEKEIKAAVNACMYDPTGQCQQRAKMMMENPNAVAQMEAAKAQGGTGVIAKSPTTGQYVPVLPQSVLEKQALKIQAALKEDANNPRSLHYDPAQATRAPASETVASAPAMAPASTGEVTSPGGGGGDGQIAR